MSGDGSTHMAARHEGRAGFFRTAACVLFVLLAGMHGIVVHADVGKVLLTVSGNIRNGNAAGIAAFDESALKTLPRHVIETTTVVTDGVRRFEGFLMRDLLAMVGAQGRTVTASALNDYVIDIPIEDFRRFDVLVATHMDGVRLQPRDKGPFWIVYPRDEHDELRDIRYDYRWVWQLMRLDVK